MPVVPRYDVRLSRPLIPGPLDPLSPATTGPRLDRRSALSRYGPVVLYLLGAAILWRPFDFIYYKDELSYLSAAARYARGDLGGVNSYWAPLLSWLLAPLLALGVSAATASDIVSVLCGLVALLGGRALIRTLGTTGWLATVCECTLAVICLYCAMRFLSADLLLAGIHVLDVLLKQVAQRRDFHDRPPN